MIYEFGPQDPLQYKLITQDFDGPEGSEKALELLKDGTHMPCGPTPLALLSMLVRGAEKERVYGYEEITAALRPGANPKSFPRDNVRRLSEVFQTNDWVENIPQTGYRFAWKVRRLNWARGAGAGNLPVAPERNFGRESLARELAAYCCRTSGGALIVLGGPGLGKTTLTLAVAADIDTVNKFGPRRWFIKFETSPNLASMQATIAASLGLERSAALDAILAELRAMPAVLVLDNLETPWEGEMSGVEDLLRALASIPDLVVIGSIRGSVEPAGMRWRHEYLTPLSWSDSQRLFLDIAQSISDEDDDLPHLLKALGGLPLAIELVARRVGNRSELIEVWREWQEVGVELARRLGVRQDRLTSLPVSIELSLGSQRLSEAGRALFSLLGQLPAGIDPHDKRVLMGRSGMLGTDELLAVGLAVPRGDRLDLLPPVRDHAIRFREPKGELAKAWVKHYLDLVTTEGLKIGTKEGGVAVNRLAAEVGNLEAALNAAIELMRTEVVGAIRSYVRFARTVRASSASPLEALAKACFETGDPAGGADALTGFADILLLRSALKAAQTTYERALELYRKQGNFVGEANCIRGLADAALELSDHRSARVGFRSAETLYRKESDVLGIANCTAALARIALERGEYREAEQLFRRALNQHRKAGNVTGWAGCIYRLGEIAREKREIKQARRCYENAMVLYQQVSSPLGEANCGKALGDLALLEKNAPAAERAFEQARRLYKQTGVVNNEGNAIRGLGDVAQLLGDIPRAMDQWKRALTLYEYAVEPNNIGSIHCRIAQNTSGEPRQTHIQLAKKAWHSIDRDDLIAELLAPLEIET